MVFATVDNQCVEYLGYITLEEGKKEKKLVSTHVERGGGWTRPFSNCRHPWVDLSCEQGNSYNHLYLSYVLLINNTGILYY